jgi:hypothetical protein
MHPSFVRDGVLRRSSDHRHPGFGDAWRGRPDLPVPNDRREISQTLEARNSEILSRLAARDAHHPRGADQRRSARLHSLLRTTFAGRRWATQAINSLCLTSALWVQRFGRRWQKNSATWRKRMKSDKRPVESGASGSRI